eukprot:CAMPEP_0182577062 /NCGR_PEP_ID=MMETSP1324-20130603/36068_1 /TAXON_ID=236786 /ORGANISM="Florenciella sp., Strain RCC1587" /LENGTH=53 /DNA_ID=CAMNT_0024792829 /DNA_START=9 /DNA_END=167 /DNA_ORIENTATION=+
MAIGSGSGRCWWQYAWNAAASASPVCSYAHWSSTAAARSTPRYRSLSTTCRSS